MTALDSDYTAATCIVAMYVTRASVAICQLVVQVGILKLCLGKREC